MQGSETGETTTSSRPIKVVDLDTITQAKEKIIEGLYSDLAYTDRPKPGELELGERINYRCFELLGEKNSKIFSF